MVQYIDKFIEHSKNTFTLQDLLDDVGHEIQRLSKLEMETMAPVQKEITLLRMFKSDIRNIIKRYQTLKTMM